MTDEVKNLGEPLTLEQMRGMRGKWAWIVSCDESKPFFGWGLVGKHHASTLQEYDEDLAVRVNYDVEEYGTVWLAYRYPPIKLDDWTAEWVKHDGYTECSKCDHWYDSPDYEDDGDRPAFCPSCGRAMTPEAWAILEHRLRG